MCVRHLDRQDIRARNGYEVAVQWADGKLRSATVKNSTPSTFKVRCGAKTGEISIEAGQTVRLNVTRLW